MFKKEHCANWMEPKKRAHMHDFKQIDLYSSKLHRSMEHHKADYKAHFNSTVEKLLKALHSIRSGFVTHHLLLSPLPYPLGTNARWF